MPAPGETEKAMVQLASSMENTSPEELFDALCKLLPLVTAEDLLHCAPTLAAAIPELAPTIGFDQRSPHHAYDLFTHIAHVTANAPPDLTLRWAALLHDVGKIPTFTQDETGRGHFYGHAGASAEMADAILRRLKAPDALREQVVFLIANHMTKIQPEQESLRRWLSRFGKESIKMLLLLQEADMGSKGRRNPGEMEQFPRLRRLIALEEAQLNDA